MTVNQSLKFRQCEIFSNDDPSKSVDLSQGVPVIEVRESVFVPYVSITLGVVDTGNTSPSSDNNVSLLESIKCQGTEKAKFKVEDAQGNTIDLSGNDDLRVAAVSSTKQDSTNQTFVLTLASKEAFDNTLLEKRCRRNYDGKISDVMQTIIRQDLDSNKRITKDATVNDIQQMGKDRTPFEMILSLQRLAIPNIPNATGKMAGYLFWQTTDGFQFRSLDKLFDTGFKTIKRFIQNNLVDENGNPPPGFHGKILRSTFNRHTNALAQMQSGAWATKSGYFDIVDGVWTQRDFVSPIRGNGIIAGRKIQKLNAEYQDKPTRRVRAVQNKGQKVTPGDNVLKQVKDDTDQDQVDLKNILEQALQSYRQKFNFSLSIIINGDLTLHAGDLIHCEFEELSTKRTPTRSPNYSGIYMIADLCHYGDRSQTYTGLHLVRDSYGVKT